MKVVEKINYRIRFPQRALGGIAQIASRKADMTWYGLRLNVSRLGHCLQREEYTKPVNNILLHRINLRLYAKWCLNLAL